MTSETKGAEEAPRPDQEGFAEAELGEAQSSDPPRDPDVSDDSDDGDEQSESGAEGYQDQDAGPSQTPEQIEEGAERDQAEG